MSTYNEMDSRWKLHGFKTKEDYQEQAVIKGYFHEGVPKDVIKEFTTAEYLMAHAWHYWLFWDEAFAKCLFILEMAVRIRAKALGIITGTKKEDGEVWKRPLANIIKDLCVEDHHDMLKASLDRARKLRNMVAHPEQQSFSGPHGADSNIKYFIITLNRLFRDRDWFVKQRVLRENIRKVIKSWGKKPIIVALGNRGSVFTSAQTLEVFEEHLMISLVPALDVSKLKEKVIPAAPLSYMIKNVQIEQGKIIGKTNNEQTIMMYASEDPKMLKVVKDSNDYLKQLSEEELRAGNDFIQIAAPWQLINMEYEYLQYLYSNQ